MSQAVVHFAHANGFPGDVYTQFLAPLRVETSVYAAPLLAHRDQPPAQRGWVNIADEIADSVRAQCVTGAIGIGHSMGGLCSLMAAYRHPGLFSALVLLDPPTIVGKFGWMMALARVMGQIDRFTPAGRSKSRRDTWPSHQAMRDNLRQKALFRDFRDDCFEDYVQHGTVPCPAGVTLRYTVASELSVFREGPSHLRPYRGGLGIPGAIITGDRSEFYRMNVHPGVARQQGFEHHVVPGGHMFPLERPDESMAFVIELLKRWRVL